ncbi:MAG: NADP-dependent oxidoreductase [Nostoc sp.]|uniref:NADP-dependent oxidoreductase n=1 Tax=Nostoc sp. TaxID=1180 RepID=UPI002FF9011D
MTNAAATVEIVATGFGDPDVLKAVAINPRSPGRGEVEIQVRAAGVNHVDYKLYSDPEYMKSHGESAPTFPLRLGIEAAGVVTAVGADATGPAGPIVVGDEVIAYRISGAYANTITVSASEVVPKPAQLSWEQAGAMMLDGTTASHVLGAVHARGGQTVLIHGAGGGVGLAAVQLAVLEGVRVIGTASEKNFDALRRYGAEPIKYGDGLLERVRGIATGGIDAAIDLVGTKEAINVSLELVSDRSRIATIVAFDRAKEIGIQALGGAPGQDDEGIAIRNAARLRLTAFAQAGAYDVVVSRSFPLAQAADAHHLLAKGGAGGRIVLIP